MEIYLDDILVTDPDDAQCLKSLKEVLFRLQKAGLKYSWTTVTFILHYEIVLCQECNYFRVVPYTQVKLWIAKYMQLERLSYPFWQIWSQILFAAKIYAIVLNETTVVKDDLNNYTYVQ